MTNPNPFPIWPFFPFAAPWSLPNGATNRPAAKEPRLEELPAPESGRGAAGQKDNDYGPFLDLVRGSLRGVTLSLTALSTRAEAMFAQLAATLAFDRALREARRAHETLRDLMSAPGRPPREQPLAESLPFADSLGLLLQGMSAALSFWSLNPLTLWNSAQASEGGAPAKSAHPAFLAWPYFSPQPRGPQAKSAIPAALNPFGSFCLGWTPPAFGFWPAAA